MFGMSLPEIIVIAVIAVLFLGPDKLPSAMVEIAKFFKPEVTLCRCVRFESYRFDLQGRADGIIRGAGAVLIDEIKTASKDVMALTEADDPDFWAQVKLYGWMVAEEEAL